MELIPVCLGSSYQGGSALEVSYGDDDFDTRTTALTATRGIAEEGYTWPPAPK